MYTLKFACYSCEHFQMMKKEMFKQLKLHQHDPVLIPTFSEDTFEI